MFPEQMLNVGMDTSGHKKSSGSVSVSFMDIDEIPAKKRKIMCRTSPRLFHRRRLRCASGNFSSLFHGLVTV